MSALLWAILGLGVLHLVVSVGAMWLVIRNGVAAVDLARRADVAVKGADSANRATTTIGPFVLGPWWALVQAVAREPEGRFQMTTEALEKAFFLPPEDMVDRYLNERWPGLELWRESDTESTGIIIRWSGRP